MANRGKLTVVGFLLLGLILGGGALWYHSAKSRWAMAFWGSEPASLIARAPQVELLRLEENPAAADPPLESFVLGGKVYRVADRRDISSAKGLIHVRQALVEDASYDLEARPPAKAAWDYVLSFQGVERSLEIAIDSQQGLVQPVVPTGTVAAAMPGVLGHIVPGLRRFLEEQFTSPAGSQAPAESLSTAATADGARPADDAADTTRDPAHKTESSAPAN